VQADIAAAAQAGVAGVPVFLVNGRIIKGAQPIAVFRKLIDEELAAATASK
jgi:predicted DsbA family dithiol-disulfide isomerase